MSQPKQGPLWVEPPPLVYYGGIRNTPPGHSLTKLVNGRYPQPLPSTPSGEMLLSLAAYDNSKVSLPDP